MVTDPARIHPTDPGHPEVCTVLPSTASLIAIRSMRLRNLAVGGDWLCALQEENDGCAYEPFGSLLGTEGKTRKRS